jgi:hypothetical protein
LKVINCNKLKLVITYKDSNCPERLCVTPNITDIWEIIINPLEHSYFGSATRADHDQINSRMIVNIIKNRLREHKNDSQRNKGFYQTKISHSTTKL